MVSEAIGLRSNTRHSAMLVKIPLDYVTRRLNALPTGSEKTGRGGLTSLRHRLARSPDPARASSLAQRGGRFTRLVAMAPGSCVDLEQSTLNKKAVYEIRQRYQTNLRPSPNPHLHRAPATDSPPATADTDVTSRRHPFLSTLIKQLPAIIAVMALLFGLWFGVATYLAPRPSYPYYDTQKPLPPWSEPTPLEGNRDRAGEHR